MYVDAVSPHSAFAPPCAGPPQGTVECFHRLQTFADSRHQGSCPSDFREHEAQQQAPRKHQGAPSGGRQAAGCGPALAASLGAPGALSVSQTTWKRQPSRKTILSSMNRKAWMPPKLVTIQTRARARMPVAWDCAGRRQEDRAPCSA